MEGRKEKRIRSEDDPDESDRERSENGSKMKKKEKNVVMSSGSSTPDRVVRGRGRGRGRGRKSDGGEASKRSIQRDMSTTTPEKEKSSDGTRNYVGLTCHQCKNLTSKSDLIFCSKCNKKRYCFDCVERWYPERTSDGVRAACPFCNGNCNCRACLREPLATKLRSEKEENVKLKQLQYLLVKVLPALREIFREQKHEVEIETQVRGFPVTESDVTWCKLDPNERIYW